MGSTFCFEIENFSVWQFHHLRRSRQVSSPQKWN